MSEHTWGNEVVYQVFPDRFHAHRAPEHPAPRAGAFHWNGHPIRVASSPRALTHRRHHQYTFMGGNLEGIRRKLDHIASLGATVLYLTPIFQARSSHRYDTDDYHTIDPMLGTAEDFGRLKHALRERGMKLVLDGVFNHTSYDHAWFTAQPEFYLRTAGGQPETWMGTGLLPKLNPEHPPLQEALLRVLDQWPEADAWRLDASHLIARRFLRRLREHLGPERLVFGEDWDDARFDLHDGLYDGVTNFAFQRNVKAFLCGDCSPETLANRLRVIYEGYPWPGVLRSWNMVGNHDTDRFFSMIGGNEARLRLAWVLQALLPGTPLIYYGDEWGQTGWGDWGARGPMCWRPNALQRARRDDLAAILKLRREHPALASGRIRFLHASNQDRTLVWERFNEQERVLVGINVGPAAVQWEGEGQTLTIPAQSWHHQASAR
ncbi:MAG: glycoside hydrolase family 13 protein [Candidatus Sericytochromatia bacterium]|nr:glycoside hydrolase family 13 protein [Candidatus Sericytochromatia bacterium]